jgi:electron transport complex protein RnfB
MKMIISIFIGFIIALLLGIFLELFARKLKVKDNPLVEKIYNVLPHNDCGGCGQPNCRAFANAVVKNSDLVNGCVVGGQETANKIADILGIEAKKATKKFAVVKCSGGIDAVDAFHYEGVKSCKAALQLGSPKLCTKGCIGLGDCVAACEFDAIHIGEKGLPIINKEKCTGCGKCVEACPQDIIELFSENDKVSLACSSHDLPAVKLKTCKNGCVGCGLCAQVCPRKAIKMVDGLPVIDQELCDGCGLCIEKCPKKVLEFVN